MSKTKITDIDINKIILKSVQYINGKIRKLIIKPTGLTLPLCITEDNEIYLPLDFIGSKKENVKKAIEHKVPVIFSDEDGERKYFLPASFLKEIVPERAKDVWLIEMLTVSILDTPEEKCKEDKENEACADSG